MKKNVLNVATVIFYGYLTNPSIKGLTFDQLQLEVRKETEKQLRISIPDAEWNTTEIVSTTLTKFARTDVHNGIAKMHTFLNNNPKVFKGLYDTCENIPTYGINFLVLTVMSVHHMHLTVTGENTGWTKEKVISYLVSRYNNRFIPGGTIYGKITPETITDEMITKIVTTSFANVKCLERETLVETFKHLTNFTTNVKFEEVKTIVNKRTSDCFNNVYENWVINSVEEPVTC